MVRLWQFGPDSLAVSVCSLLLSTTFTSKTQTFASVIGRLVSRLDCLTYHTITNAVPVLEFSPNSPLKKFLIATEPAFLIGGRTIYELEFYPILSEHKTAVIDIRGVHAQLLSLFQHKRIRLIPSWQQLCQNDYLRFYQIDLNRSETPLVYDIAHRLSSDPDPEAAQQHLQYLL